MPIYLAPAFDRNFVMNGQPTGVLRENFVRPNIDSNLSAQGTGVMRSTVLPLQKGDVITNLTFVSGSTAAVNPSHWWFALYDTSGTPALVYQTADQTSTAWGTNTPKTLALSSVYTVPTTGVYYASMMMVADTLPTIMGAFVGTNGGTSAVISGQAVMGYTSGSSLTTTAPATITSATVASAVMYVAAT